MELYSRQRRDAELARLQRVKGSEAAAMAELGQQVVSFFRSVEKRQKKFGRLAEAWMALVPPLLQEHCCLESLSRGTLTVIVDSPSHLYDLKQLLLAGLEKQILLACRSAGLRKVALKFGRWYENADAQDRKLRFD